MARDVKTGSSQNWLQRFTSPLDFHKDPLTRTFVIFCRVAAVGEEPVRFVAGAGRGGRRLARRTAQRLVLPRRIEQRHVRREQQLERPRLDLQ